VSPRRSLAQRARAAAPGVPLYAGFGISSPADAHAAAELTDGVVVGSRALEAGEAGPSALREFVRSLRESIDGR
jgi:tryptophan synthase alpha chain